MDKNKKLVIFDLDGTLADTLEDLADAVNYGLEKLGYPVQKLENYKRFVGNGVLKLCERALPDDKKFDTAKLHSLFEEFYRVHYLDKTREYDGISKLLKKLAENGSDIAVATNKPQNFAREIVSKLFKDICFIKVLGGCSDRAKKPSPEIINEIISGDIYDEIYMIGDSDVDIITAKNAGIKSIGCLWGFRGKEELENSGADYIVEHASEILDIIIDK